MQLSISTFKILCELWNYPQEVLENKDYLQKSIDEIDRTFINYTEQEQQTAKEEIKQLIDTI